MPKKNRSMAALNCKSAARFSMQETLQAPVVCLLDSVSVNFVNEKKERGTVAPLLSLLME